MHCQGSVSNVGAITFEVKHAMWITFSEGKGFIFKLSNGNSGFLWIASMCLATLGNRKGGPELVLNVRSTPISIQMSVHTFDYQSECHRKIS